VLAATFVLTVLRDLTTGILAGCLLAAAFWALTWLRRETASTEHPQP
jgi:MFS superfamily sulfate permease-like transporter